MTAVEFVRVRDMAALRDGQQVTEVAMAYDLVAFPASPLTDLLSILDGTMNSDPIESWVGYVEGRAVASTHLRWHEHDNPEVSMADTWVLPDHRRRGVATAAVELLRTRARELGKKRILWDVPSLSHGTSPSPGEQMAAALGLKAQLVELRRVLDVTALDDVDLDRLWKQARAKSADYDVLTWVDRVPDEYAADLAELMVVMSTDAPQGESDLEAEVWTVARYQEWEQDIINRGRRRLIAAVRDTTSGRLVGVTDLGKAEGLEDFAFQWTTIVRAEHRGHRLGMVLKLANLQQLRRELPRVRYLNTWNADTNSYMIAVNEAVGFQVIDAWTRYELPV